MDSSDNFRRSGHQSPASDHWRLITDRWPRITTIDAHTAGEPLRIITGGLPPIPGDTIVAKRRYAREHLDDLRTALMWEPRGHADMYGCIPTEPVTPDGTLGVLFLHNEGWSTMCGHGVIGLVKVGIETGLLAPDPVVRVDTPAGRVTAYPGYDDDGRVTGVSFDNVPSFVFALDQAADVPGLGRVRYDMAFGGAFYAYVRAEDFGLRLEADDFMTIIDLGKRIKRAIMASHIPQHPFEAELSLLYGTIFVGPAHDPANHSREVCVFADGEVDRSPTGTGVSGRAALHYANGEIGLNQPFVVESILGTTFTGEAVEEATFGPYPAVVPRVSGTAHITGRNEWVLDPKDPLREGFLLR
ncbi:MAG: proline racemase family protein [Anaerolineae bacterium]|nr:proline racemase family protein [Anaerolineae bacterium]